MLGYDIYWEKGGITVVIAKLIFHMRKDDVTSDFRVIFESARYFGNCFDNTFSITVIYIQIASLHESCNACFVIPFGQRGNFNSMKKNLFFFLLHL